jgi:hypothetical protein
MSTHQTRVPVEPIVLPFGPEGPTTEEVRAVFGDPIARALWILIKASGHIVDQNFNKWCLRMAEDILVFKDTGDGVITARELYGMVHHQFNRSFPGGAMFLENRYEDSQAFCERLAEAINGTRPIVCEFKEFKA